MMMAAISWVCQRSIANFTVAIIALISITSCTNYSLSYFDNKANNRTASRWEKSGEITISRANPGVLRNLNAGSSHSASALGFVPSSLHGAPAGAWLSINTSTDSLELMKGDQVVAQLKGAGIKSLRPGLFKVKHKQRNPLWYAPDNYFSARNLPSPVEGDKSRFRRGALGDFVIFLDQETPIHSGPIWLDAIGGVRMEEADLSKLYYSLEVGAAVEVK